MYRLKPLQCVLVVGPVATGAVLAFVFYPHVEVWLALVLPRRDRDLLALQGRGMVDTRLRLSISVALVLLTPEAIWKGWRALRPHASPAQLRLQRRLMPLVAVVPALGVALAYRVVLRWYERSSSGFGGSQLHYLLQASAFVPSALLVVLLTIVGLAGPVFVLGLGGRGTRSWSE